MQPNPNDSREPTSRAPEDPGKRFGFGRVLIFFLAIWLLLPWVLRLAGVGVDDHTRIDYSAFRQQLRDGNVQAVTVQGDEVRGTLKTAAKDKTGISGKDFRTFLPSFGDAELLTLLEQKGVQVRTLPADDGGFWLMLSSLLPFLLLIVLAYWFFRRMRLQGQQLFSMGESRAKLYDRKRERTMFDDVAGAEGAKAELREIIEFLKDPGRFRELGGKPPKGVLLVGPPGTGKTLLARATAGEAGVPFISISGSDFMEMFVGVGASRVRNLFRDARKAGRSIIFIDELDSIGRRRGAGLGGGHDEREQTLNQLLSEMDGFESREGVIVMAATNRPDILDPALLRPGRFDRRISVDLPGINARRDILAVHARNKPLADDVDLTEIARGTPGFSGADLQNLLNEAALHAARKRKKVIERSDIDQARDKILLGLEREGLALTAEEVQLLAYHEAGHAVVAAVLPHADPIHKATIVPRGRAMGVTQQLPERERYVYSREYMLERMAVMMGGRAAEELVLGTSTSGAESDLKEVIHLARKMVLDWGMTERLGHLALGGKREHVFLGEEIAEGREYSEATAREVDQEIKAIIDRAFALAKDTLRQYRDGLERVAEALRQHEEITGRQILELVGLSHRSPSPRGLAVNG